MAKIASAIERFLQSQEQTVEHRTGGALGKVGIEDVGEKAGRDLALGQRTIVRLTAAVQIKNKWKNVELGAVGRRQKLAQPVIVIGVVFVAGNAAIFLEGSRVFFLVSRLNLAVGFAVGIGRFSVATSQPPGLSALKHSDSVTNKLSEWWRAPIETTRSISFSMGMLLKLPKTR